VRFAGEKPLARPTVVVSGWLALAVGGRRRRASL